MKSHYLKLASQKTDINSNEQLTITLEQFAKVLSVCKNLHSIINQIDSDDKTRDMIHACFYEYLKETLNWSNDQEEKFIHILQKFNQLSYEEFVQKVQNNFEDIIGYES